MKKTQWRLLLWLVGFIWLTGSVMGTKAAGSERKTSSGFIYTTGSYVTITGYTGNKTAISVPATIGGKTVKKIANSAFWFQKDLKKVVLPKGLKVIGISAFFGCDSLLEVSVPNTVTTIGMSAFAHCPNLKSVTLSTAMKEIPWSLFEGCTALEKIKIPSKVTTIGCYAFSDCNHIQNIAIPSKVTMIGDCAFRACTRLVKVTLPAGLEEIADEAFLHCKSLKAISLPHKLEGIGDYALGYYVSSGNVKRISSFSISCHKGTEGYLYAKANGLTQNLKLQAHTLKTNLEKANLYGNGVLEQICTECGVTAKKKTIYSPKTFSVVKKNVLYTGQAQMPEISVKDVKGNLISSENYSVSKVTNCKLVGSHTLKVTLKKYYSGSTSVKFTILPKGISIQNMVSEKAGFTAYWKAQKEQTTGYQLQYAQQKDFGQGQVYEQAIDAEANPSAKIANLLSNTTYYVRIRTFKTISGVRYYSPWSKTTSVDTK